MILSKKFIQRLEQIKQSIRMTPQQYSDLNDYYKGLADGQNDFIEVIIDEATNWSEE